MAIIESMNRACNPKSQFSWLAFHVTFQEPNKKGDTMKTIDISTKKYPKAVLVVDDCDYDELIQYAWYVIGSGKKPYAGRLVNVGDKRKAITIHRHIMEPERGQVVDHIDGNPLNNTRKNLRCCTQQQNLWNQGCRQASTSGYKGVSWHKRDKKWQVVMRIKGKVTHLGRFTCLMKAARVYDKAAIESHGEFARTNF
jgi:hypothetical protein